MLPNIQVDARRVAAIGIRATPGAPRPQRHGGGGRRVDGTPTVRRRDAGGAQALGRPIGAIAEGLRADIVVLDANHPDLGSRRGDRWLDAWIFVAGRAAVTTVLVGGEVVVRAGRHRARPEIEARYKNVLSRLAEA